MKPSSTPFFFFFFFFYKNGSLFQTRNLRWIRRVCGHYLKPYWSSSYSLSEKVQAGIVCLCHPYSVFPGTPFCVGGSFIVSDVWSLFSWRSGRFIFSTPFKRRPTLLSGFVCMCVCVCVCVCEPHVLGAHLRRFRNMEPPFYFHTIVELTQMKCVCLFVPFPHTGGVGWVSYGLLTPSLNDLPLSSTTHPPQKNLPPSSYSFFSTIGKIGN